MRLSRAQLVHGPCVSAVLARGHRKRVAHFAFGSSNASGMGQWQFEESKGRVPDAFGPPLVLRLSPLLDQSTVSRLSDAVKGLLYEQKSDSVDGKPTFQSLIFEKGRPVAPDSVTRELLPAVEERLVPYVRERFACPSCVVCTAIVRRYERGERLEHPWHFDSQAYVTVVVPLSAREHYIGGFYVQPDFDREHREFVELEAGDAVLHSFDLLHGVEVMGGERVSLVFWLKTSSEACEQESSPWYIEGAARGDARAQFNLASIKAHGEGNETKDQAAGVELYRKAADQGYVLAMYNLAVALHHGRGTGKDLPNAALWYARAANAGHPKSMTNYGAALLHGLGDTEINATAAGGWFQKAAFQGVDVAMFKFGELIASGTGIASDLAEAACWFEEAGKMGHKQAMTALAKLQK